MADHIFISYARKDQIYARKLRDELARRGFEVWLDDRIDFGDRWWRTIVQAIRASAALVVVMTPQAEESEWVEREILLAQREGKPIFPLLLRGQEFPIFITTQFIDVSGDRLPPDRFYRGVGRVVPTKSAAPEPLSEPEPTTQPQILSPRESFEPEMILIPAGEFLMGSDPKKDKNAEDNEQPQHRLELPDYYIARTPVTNAQYAAFVAATGHRAPHRDTTCKPYNWSGQTLPAGKEDHPVVLIDWHDAVAYCHWLAEVTGRSYRLPSEAEWEKAARGSDGRIYPWGDTWDKQRCNTSEGGKGGTTPVGAYPNGASPYGVLDMAGNVWEWCATKWGKPYPYDTGVNEWHSDYLKRAHVPVLRGGSWTVKQSGARCATRYVDVAMPVSRGYSKGLRVVVSPIY